MRSRYKVDPSHNMYFITSTIIDWTPLLINEKIMQIVTDSFTYCRRNKGLRLFGYVIMPNHKHAIIATEEGKQIPGVVRDFKRHTSQEISNYLKGLGDKSDLFWLRPFWSQKWSRVWQGVSSKDCSVRRNVLTKTGILAFKSCKKRICLRAGSLEVLQCPELCH